MSRWRTASSSGVHPVLASLLFDALEGKRNGEEYRHPWGTDCLHSVESLSEFFLITSKISWTRIITLKSDELGVSFLKST